MAVNQERIIRIIYAGMHYRAAFNQLQSLISCLQSQLDPLTYMRLTDLNHLIPTKLQDDLILTEEGKHFYKTWKDNERRARYNRVRRGQDPSIVRRPQIARGLTPEQMVEALVRDGTPPSTRRDLDQPIRHVDPPRPPSLTAEQQAAIDREANELFAEEERDAGYNSMFKKGE